MDTHSFAFVDLETTGVSPSADRVTEIGVVRVDRGRIVDEWSSLVDPGVPIPAEIQALTGITNEMVRSAPRFSSLLPEIERRLTGRIFVAHNARFDYGFVKAEFRRAGARFSADVLCTVRLSRRLFPQYASHRLDSLIDRHRLQGADRHRALGDARLIWRFLEKLWAEEDRAALSNAIEQLLKQPATPPHLPAGALEALPESPGVYVFVGASGQPLYVGKAGNLRDRVRAHFYAGSRNANDARLIGEVHRIDVEETAGDFSALLREIQLIKSCAPLHNVALRRRDATCFLRPSDAGRPPRVVPLADVEPLDEPLLWGPFGSRQAARAVLARLAREHRLCDRGVGLWAHEGPCFARQLRRCSGLCVGDEDPDAHHRRLIHALEPLRLPRWPFDGPVLLREADPESGRSAALKFDRWRAIGGHADSSFDPDVYRLLRRAIERGAVAFEPSAGSNDRDKALDNQGS
jgi:DNA polymerase III subunit epsilon